MTGKERLRRALRRREREGVYVPRVVAEVSQDHLLSNYEAVQRLHRDQSMIPMIKANAYGHGIEWVARALADAPMLEGLGVATLEEGAQVRAAVGVNGRRVPVIVFSECVAWSDEKGSFCEMHGLRPVIASDSDFERFLRGGWARRLPYDLKFNTGMNRLGLSFARLQAVRKTLSALPPEERPQGVLSHLAIADDPGAKLTVSQLDRFRQMVRELKPVAPGARFHVANSAAIWNSKRLGLEGLTDVVRPGISLYGVVPWPEAPRKGLRQVMRLRTSIIQVHELMPGESLGYGATYRAPRGEGAKRGASRRVAILPAGYADGLHRFSSNRGRVSVMGSEERFLGIVSMDLSAISCPRSAGVGDWVDLLGEDLPIWEQSREAGTLPYELLTSVSARVQRVHV